MFYRCVGFLYLMSGILCVVNMESAADFLGFGLDAPKGFLEFFSVYGGLQVGLGSAMLISSFEKRYIEASNYFSAIFSTSLVLFRFLSFCVFGVIVDFIIMFLLELLIALGLWVSWKKTKKLHQLGS